MNHWPFIAAAYTIAVGGTAGLTLWSWRAMRDAEKQAESLRKRP